MLNVANFSSFNLDIYITYFSKVIPSLHNNLTTEILTLHKVSTTRVGYIIIIVIFCSTYETKLKLPTFFLKSKSLCKKEQNNNNLGVHLLYLLQLILT